MTEFDLSKEISVRSLYSLILVYPVKRKRSLYNSLKKFIMGFENFTPIKKLNDSQVKWHIRVRAQAIWKGIQRDTKEFRGINIMFVDDSVRDF